LRVEAVLSESRERADDSGIVDAVEKNFPAKRRGLPRTDSTLEINEGLVSVEEL
jgi:hypothetical protein